MTNSGSPSVIAPNFKRRMSGVTATVLRLVPVQARAGLGIAAVGRGLPGDIPRIRVRDLWRLRRRPDGRPFRIWHARRNVEMAAGVVLRDVLRFPLALVFTSAAQRRHRPFTRWLIGRMDAVIATSAASAAFLDRPATVIHHGVDTGRFRPGADGNGAEAAPASAHPGGSGDPEPPSPALRLPDSPPRGEAGSSGQLIGCFGRIRPQKGTDLFVDAMVALLPGRPGWQAVILGRTLPAHAGFRAALEARIAAAGLGARIRFLGEVSDDAVRDWYRHLSLYVAPQRWEGFGLTPLEAMASGAAVVATRVGAAPLLVAEGVTGTLVPPDDGAALTAAVARWLDDPAGLAAARRAARAHVEAHHRIEDEAAAIGAVYEGLWRDRPARLRRFTQGAPA